MTEHAETLYEAIVRELGRMDTVKIRFQSNSVNELPRPFELTLIQGTVDVGYKTEAKPYLWGLFKIEKPLASLEDIRSSLA